MGKHAAFHLQLTVSLVHQPQSREHAGGAHRPAGIRSTRVDVKRRKAIEIGVQRIG